MEFRYGTAANGPPVLLALILATFLPLTTGEKCQPGLVLPVWMPQEDLYTGEAAVRGIAYFLAMLHLFLGVSIISDRFMGAIEVITSKKMELKVKLPNGGSKIVVVNVWNQTVANLTLMALGSSAPEILLSIIEIMGKNFEAGELGPGTIVGSAAFNLLIIIAICVYVIPVGEVRRIKHLHVFIVTATWSVFAYIWLLIILKVTSPGVVEIWEGLLTFLFFPATVFTAYVADRKILVYKFTSKRYRLNKHGLIVEGEGNLPDLGTGSDLGIKVLEEEESDDEVREFEQNRRDYIHLLRELRKKHPDLGTGELEAMAREQITITIPKSRAFYRMQATRRLSGGGNLFHRQRRAESIVQHEVPVLPVNHPQEQGHDHDQEPEIEDPFVTSIRFDPPHYTVMENVGTFEVSVQRRGGDLNQVVFVDLKTEDGTALAGSDYVPEDKVIKFLAGEGRKVTNIRILDDDVFERDEHFYVRLSNPRFGSGSDGPRKSRAPQATPLQVRLVHPFVVTVMILDDDHHGIFSIEDRDIETVESIGQLEVNIVRGSGARGKVQISYATVEGTAKPGKDYEAVSGTLLFENGERSKTVSIPIIEEDSYEKDVLFYLEISNAVLIGNDGNPIPQPKKTEGMSKQEIIALEGWPVLGPDVRAQIRVKESKEFKGTVDKLLQRGMASILAGTSSWKEQFVEAVTVNGGDNDDADAEPKPPTFGDYVMHFLTVIWKIIFAFVPPTDICGGYLTFVVSIGGIGVLTALIGDLAAHFGCSVGLKDSVTAIVFVALGTSIPDTFASMVAAVQDEFADASVGNVTGSNAVNVFLGIGIAWTIAAIVHACKSCPVETPDCNVFKVDPGSLGFSVTLFCVCAVVAIAVMLIRRLKAFGGGELGGPTRFKHSTVLLFVALWIFYILMSSLESYGKIQGF